MTKINNFDVLAIGELLIDFTMSGNSPTGMRLFEQNPGGAPANVLYALAGLGRKTAFIGKVGNDMHGKFLQRTLAQRGIDIENLILDDTVFTTLAFVQIAENGERSFSFARKPGADTCLTKDELSHTLLRQTRIFHFGSLSLTQEPARSATIHAVKTAKEFGAIISYDPNYRTSLWNSPREAVSQMRSVLPYVDLIKISLEEVALLTDHSSPEQAARQLLGQGIQCVVITLGERGSALYTDDVQVTVPAYVGPVVDTTGAGDAFWGGFLHSYLKNEEAEKSLRFANAVAMLCVGRHGGIPAMPSLKEVEKFMSDYQERLSFDC